MVNQTRGPNKGGKIVAVDGDIDIKSIAFNPAEMLDTKLTIQEIASVTGCPINKLIGSIEVSCSISGLIF